MAKVVDGTELKGEGWRRFRRLKVDKGKLKRRARRIEVATLKHANRFISKRWTNVRDVARNAGGWLLAVGLLIGLSFFQMFWFQNAYTTDAPEAGGTYAEGMIGSLDTINPLFASTPAEVSASRLIFSGLLDYDKDNALRPSVAETWSISEDGRAYSVKLRDDVYWHDGTKLTADDVVFTVKLMQNPEVRAQQYNSWTGITLKKNTERDIVFQLPSVYAPFAHSLTFGILPEHILKDVKPSSMRENEFGRQPTGSGPFAFRRIQTIDVTRNRSVVHMEAFARYYRGAPLLNRFQIHTYETYDALARAFRTDEVNAAMGLRLAQIPDMTQPSIGGVMPKVRLHDGVYALFNADTPLLSDKALRQALVAGTDRGAILEMFPQRVVALEGPLVPEQVGAIDARQPAFNFKKAETQLEGLGWAKQGEVRKKDANELTLNIVAPDSGDYRQVVDELVKQWRRLGIRAAVTYVATQEIASGYLQPRNYDVLVYELALGADPDIYAYWHSSQAKSTGLNFANYRSGLADDQLSSARGRLDPALRTAKYQAFTQQWLQDAPAIALYQPLLSYVKNSDSTSMEDGTSEAEPAGRYHNVERWAVSKIRVMSTP